MISWQIKNIERNISDGGVIKVYWKCKIEENNEEALTFYTHYTSGSLLFSPDPESEFFIPYEDLTEEIVMEWVKERLDVETIETLLSSKIEAQKNPTQESGLPWNLKEDQNGRV